MALDRLFGLGLGTSGLMPLARRLGADVPFFLIGGPALGLAPGGAGSPLQRQVRGHVVLVDPGHPVSTAKVFARVDARLTPRENGTTIFRFVSSDLEGSGLFAALSNDLEEAALEEAPVLQDQVRTIRGLLVGVAASVARSVTGSAPDSLPTNCAPMPSSRTASSTLPTAVLRRRRFLRRTAARRSRNRSFGSMGG